VRESERLIGKPCYGRAPSISKGCAYPTLTNPRCDVRFSMSNALKTLRRADEAGVDAMQSSAPHRFQAAGKTIVCSHCGSDLFASFGVVGLSLAGYGLQCSKCTRLEYFASQPTQLEYVPSLAAQLSLC
jgi:hypothetical protein